MNSFSYGMFFVMRRFFTPAQEAEVIARYQARERITHLAAEYGCSVEPIRGVLRRHNVPRWNYRDSEITERAVVRDEIIRAYTDPDSGETRHAIAKRLGISFNAVGIVLREAEVPVEVSVVRAKETAA